MSTIDQLFCKLLSIVLTVAFAAEKLFSLSVFALLPMLVRILEGLNTAEIPIVPKLFTSSL